MADSIDRVFAQALATIRALSNPKVIPATPIQRPPIEDRIHLYGLYKQATEGDVDVLMERPTGDREEDEAARKKWDAWYSQRGLRKTEAKRRYIPFLLDTMRKYASSTPESRELISELQFLWDQVKDVQDMETESPPSPSSILLQNQPKYPSTTSFSRVSEMTQIRVQGSSAAAAKTGRETGSEVAEEPSGDDEDDESVMWQKDLVAAMDSLSVQVSHLRALVTGTSSRKTYFVTAPSTPSQSLSRNPSHRHLRPKKTAEPNSGKGRDWRGTMVWIALKFWRFTKRVAFDIILIAALITFLRWQRNLRHARAVARV
ncbi:acyl CoA binding protein-domain-containing protein [Lipomyces orientalis]|uniref:Acyl CoA binding protein-domain-containing protein n=1 Tax=Lipomyces orientalis TaxID=1233043 RepID=A0ACC3TUY5_9ASCO